MFLRLLGGLLRSSRGRLVVAILALSGGAAVISALLSMEADVQRKLSHEFRTLGPNLIVQPVIPRGGSNNGVPALLDASIVQRIQSAGLMGANFLPYLYVVAKANDHPIVVAGTWLDAVPRVAPWWKLTKGTWISARGVATDCLLGTNAARVLNAAPGSQIELQSGGRTVHVTIAGIFEAGADEDNQVFVDLGVAQQLSGMPGEISLVAVSVPGDSAHIEDAERKLVASLPDAEVRPLRQVNEAQVELASRLRLLVFSMVVLILLLTGLCVLATMAALAVERRRDVGLMLALGGSISRVVQLFLAEAAAMGATSGVAGYLVGIVLARWIGWRVFDAAISPRWEILPLTIALTMGVALAGALPLRLLGRVRPAVILRGEA
jgi:putative ABC transport system permease protein